MTAEFDDATELSGDDEIRRLVEQAHDGDVDALNDLFARYHQTMVEVARRKLGPRLRLKEDPDDLAQTTFREATRDFGRYEYQGQGSLLRWLVQILQNKIRDKAEFYSAGKRDVSRERAIDAGTGEDTDAPLSELSAEHRRAISLVFFEGLPLREAGARMGGKSEDAVRMMLRRAESKLGDKLRSNLGKEE